MIKPNTLEEAEAVLLSLVSEDPTLLMVTFIDELVTLVCREGSPIPTALEKFKRLQLYKAVIARTLQRKSDRDTPSGARS